MKSKFALLTFPGLGKLGEDEIKKLGIGKSNFKRLPNYDLVTFELGESEAKNLRRSKIAEDIFYVIIENFKIDNRGDLSKLNKLITQPSIFKALNIKNAAFGEKKHGNVTFNCFIKQDKDRFVPRKTIAASVINLIHSHFRKWKITDPALVEFWGFYIEEKLMLGLRLSDHSLRYRGQDPSLREGALRPTIAAALIHLAGLKPNEVVVDPMCGTGTILLEGSLKEGKCRYLGGDISEEAVDQAQFKLKNRNIQLQKWDATNLPLEKSTIDCIVTNLPFGKQYSTIENNKILYDKLLIEWNQKLRSNGRMILLTSDSENIEASLNKLSLPWKMVTKIKVLGSWANVYKVTK